MPSPVSLNIYDVSSNPQVEKLNKYLTAVGTGAFHGGIEIYGKEYSYGYVQNGTGLFACQPKGCTMHHYRESYDLGECSKSEKEVADLVKEMEAEWPGKEYDLLRHNCVFFSAELAKRLGVKDVPAWVTNLAGAGATIQDGAMQAATAAQAAAIMAAAKAGEMNQKYDISGQAAARVTDMIAAAGELDEKYKIKEKAGQYATQGADAAVKGAQTAAAKAVELDEKYHIKEKAGQYAAQGADAVVKGAQAAVAKAVDLDEKYHLKEKAADGAKQAAEGAKQVVFKVGELAEKHKVTEKLADLKDKAKDKMHEFDEKHHITEKMQEQGCGACVECVVQ